MEAQGAGKYQRATRLREGAVELPSEMEIQAAWFQQLYRPVLTLDDGSQVEIIQPGIWNHGAGPDFIQAAVRWPNGTLATGPVEVHLQAIDWERHGHHLDPNYNSTLLHVVWQAPTQTYFPRTQEHRHVPQLILCRQLIGAWEVIRPLLEIKEGVTLPQARPGLCQRELKGFAPDRIVDVLRSAGEFRFQQKVERWRWRTRVAGMTQVLWEALAESLGFHQNKIPFRLLAQRLNVKLLNSFSAEERTANLFGAAGFLPSRELASFSPAARAWVRPCWEIWWRNRTALDHVILPKTQWRWAGVRPSNRPERRLAALAGIFPMLGRLEKALAMGDDKKFRGILAGITDPFWDRHASLKSRPWTKETALIGLERLSDILVNVFWPLVAIDRPELARVQLGMVRSSANHATEIARQRVLGKLELGPAWREALVQQGLLQIYRDFCSRDASDCHQCAFPEIVRKWH